MAGGGVSVSDGCDRYHKYPGLTGNGVRLVINLKKLKKTFKILILFIKNKK
jgi:hypothetical protein